MSVHDGNVALRALVIQHEQSTPGGYVHEWLRKRGADQEILRIDIDAREVDPADFDAIVSLGSGLPAFEDSVPWIERERRLLRDAAETDVAILGICFGAQLLARALGGQCFRSEQPEVGWLPVRTRAPALVAEGPWFLWHFDTFTPPPGARLIADSPAGTQAYTSGRSLGVQFHPEATPEIVDAWVGAYRHELDQQGVDPDQLLALTNARAERSRASAWRLFDAFLHQVAGLREAVRERAG